MTGSMRRASATDDALRANVIMKNAVGKQLSSNAVARFVTSFSLSHLSVTRDAFEDMILVTNLEAEH
jgi:hypothetical protein